MLYKITDRYIAVSGTPFTCFTCWVLGN